MGIKSMALELATIAPGTHKYAELLVKGLKSNYPRGYAFLLKQEEQTDETLITLYQKENYKFMMWVEMILWYEEVNGK